MSDKEIIKVLKKIQLYCAGKQCHECKFFLNDNYCQILLIAELLKESPCDWNMNRIEGEICK